MSTYLIATKNRKDVLITPRIIKADTLYDAEKIYKISTHCSWCMCCGTYISYWSRSIMLSKGIFNKLLEVALENLQDYFESTQADLQTNE